VNEKLRLVRNIAFWPLIVSILALVCFGGETDNSQYLPLKVGKKWVLRSKAVGKPMVVEVVGRNGDGYRVRWDNPLDPKRANNCPQGRKVLYLRINYEWSERSHARGHFILGLHRNQRCKVGQ